MRYANALDNIFAALKNKRLFDRFGFNLPKQGIKETNTKWISNYENWQYSTEACRLDQRKHKRPFNRLFDTYTVKSLII